MVIFDICACCVKTDMKYELERDWLLKTVDIIIDHLNKFGVCVLDDFLGADRGADTLEEVLGLRAAQLFREGQLVAAPSVPAAARYRSDEITWTDGVTPHSPAIRNLIRSVYRMETKNILMTKKYFQHFGRDRDGGEHAAQQQQGAAGGVRGLRAVVACYPGQVDLVTHIINFMRVG